MKVNNKYLSGLQDFNEPNETARLRKFSNYLYAEFPPRTLH